MRAIDWAPLIEGMLEAVWVVDPLTLRIVAVNQAACQLQGLNNVYLAGAWMKYGFHEDGHTSGLNVARALISKLSNNTQKAA